MRHVLLTLAIAALLAVSAAAVVVWRGWYDVSAGSSHTAAVYRLLEVTMERSVRRRAAGIQVPRLDDPALAGRGAACYRDHCEQCHGGPAVAPGPAAMGLQPLPGPLVDAGRRFTPGEIYWIIRHGIKMSGMPAWELRLSERDLWAVTAFVQRLPGLTSASYRESTMAHAGSCPVARDDATADLHPLAPRRPHDAARLALRQYACIGCHRIPGIEGPDANVGPPLEGWARRTLIAGRRPNTQEELVSFIRRPHSVDPNTAMPQLGVTEAHARLMAEYLLAQH